MRVGIPYCLGAAALIHVALAGRHFWIEQRLSDAIDAWVTSVPSGASAATPVSRWMPGAASAQVLFPYEYHGETGRPLTSCVPALYGILMRVRLAHDQYGHVVFYDRARQVLGFARIPSYRLHPDPTKAELCVSRDGQRLVCVRI